MNYKAFGLQLECMRVPMHAYSQIRGTCISLVCEHFVHATR